MKPNLETITLGIRCNNEMATVAQGGLDTQNLFQRDGGPCYLVLS